MIYVLYFAIYLVINFQNISCGNGDDQDVPFSLKIRASSDLLSNFTTPRTTIKIKEDTSYMNAVLIGIKAGITDAIQFATKEAFRYPLSGIRVFLAASNIIFWRIVYKLSFGANKLNCNTLMLINNHIYTLCSPLVENKKIVNNKNDKEWQILKLSLISELRHAYFYLKKALPCYSPLYLKNKYKRNPLNSIFYSFRENNEQISFYMVRTIFYIESLIKHIESLDNYDVALKNASETRQWLSWICESFEQISKFLDQDKMSKYQFNKIENEGNFSLLPINNIGD